MYTLVNPHGWVAVVSGGQHPVVGWDTLDIIILQDGLFEGYPRQQCKLRYNPELWERLARGRMEGE